MPNFTVRSGPFQTTTTTINQSGSLSSSTSPTALYNATRLAIGFALGAASSSVLLPATRRLTYDANVGWGANLMPDPEQAFLAWHRGDITDQQCWEVAQANG